MSLKKLYKSLYVLNNEKKAGGSNFNKVRVKKAFNITTTWNTQI